MAAILADDIFKRIFLNENGRIPIQVSLSFIPKSPIDNIPALVPVMAWRRTGDKPLPEPMIYSVHRCIYATLEGDELSLRQNDSHFADDILKCIFLNEKVWILIKMSLKIVPQGPFDKMLALVQIMAWQQISLLNDLFWQEHIYCPPIFSNLISSYPIYLCSKQLGTS